MNRLGLVPLILIILVLTSAISWNLFTLSSVEGTCLLLDEPTFTKTLPTWKRDGVWLPLGLPEITKNANSNFTILDVRGDSIQS